MVAGRAHAALAAGGMSQDVVVLSIRLGGDIGERMPTLIVREVEDTLHLRLKREARRRGVSVNALTRQLLSDAVSGHLAPDSAGRFSELDALAGTWSAADVRRFNAATRSFSEIGASLWQ
jgi:plasmid stability protein